MGDISEMRGLIVCVTFIATAITLILLIPPSFMSIGANQQVNPTEGNTRNILAYNDTYFLNYTGNRDGTPAGTPPLNHVHSQLLDVGGHSVLFTESFYKIDNDPLFMNLTSYWFVFQTEMAQDIWGYRYNQEDFKWYNQNGTDTTTNIEIEVNDGNAIFGNVYHWVSHDVLTLAQVDMDAHTQNSTLNNTLYNPQIQYTLKSSSTTFQAQFSYNISAFTAPSQAYQNLTRMGNETSTGGLSLTIGIDFSERASQINAWDLITGFLFFQLIPQLPTTISLLIEVPIWIAEAYLIFIFILRVIGAVFGGGGA